MRVIFAIFLLLISSSPVFAATQNITGWAWSSVSSWTSFTCANLNSCASVDYGVKIDEANGLFSGFAWSDRVGWISFNKEDLAGCPSGVCEARVAGGLSGGTFPKKVSGWAKVLKNSGWMSLRGTASDGNEYGVQLEPNGEFSGWSWEAKNIGWLSWKGTNYKVKTALTEAPAEPPAFNVDLTANGFDGTITVPSGSSATLSWTSSGAVSCAGSGDWTGSKPANGTETVPNITETKTFTLACSDSQQNIKSDSVTINVPLIRLTDFCSVPPPASSLVPTIPLSSMAIPPSSDPNIIPIYGAYIEPATGLFSGLVWSDRVGWISFNKEDLAGCPSGVCEARVAGGLSGGTFPKKVSGWAKVLKNSGWMSLRGTASNGNEYGVQLEPNGEFSGWSCEKTDIGWLRWNGANYAVKASLPSQPSLPPPPAAPGPGIDSSLSLELKANGFDKEIIISPGEDILLAWKASNAFFCNASGDWSGVKNLAGSETIANIASSKVFTLSCGDGAGNSVSDSITVKVPTLQSFFFPPTVNLKANGADGRTEITSGMSVNLSWNSENASECVASGDWSGDKDTAGSETLNNITSNKTFILTCFDGPDSGEDRVSAEIVQTLEPPPFIAPPGEPEQPPPSAPEPSLGEDLPEAIEEITAGVTEVSETFREIIAGKTEIAELPGAVNQLIKKLRSAPAVVRSVKKIAVPISIAVTAVGAGSLTVTAAAGSAAFAINLNQLAYSLSFSRFYILPLLRFRKRKPWGRVLNKVTHEPVSGTAISIYDADSRKMIDAQLTDSEGRFGTIISRPGQYYLTAAKDSWETYQSDLISVTSSETILSLEIYLAPQEKELTLPRLKRLAILNKLRRLIESINPYLLVLGTLISLLSLILVPNFLNYIVFAVYLLLDGLKIYFSFRFLKPFGRVMAKESQEPLALAVVRVFNAKGDYLLTTKVTDANGKFSFLLAPGSYYFTCLKSGFAPFRSNPLELRKAGLASIDIAMERAQPI